MGAAGTAHPAVRQSATGGIWFAAGRWSVHQCRARKRIRARKHTDANGVKHYEIYGALFFGSISAFNDKFDVLNDPDEVTIDFAESRVVDMPAIEALNRITERYLKVGKKLHLKHLSPDCRKLLKNAGDIIDVNVMEDPTYKVMTDAL